MKRIYGLPLTNLKIVPEKMIFDAAVMFQEEDPNNSFVRLLNAANEFRDAGLTPMFLSDINMHNLMVTTEEKLQKNYH